MLSQLNISNFAIIENLEISFPEGLNIISGETGAGKSIIINAMNLLLGARASSHLIRKGAKEARVEGLFHISADPGLTQLLDNEGIPFEGELVIKRSISRDGRNRIQVNGTMVTLGFLSRLGGRIISISGQNEHQMLLRPEHQLLVIDQYGDLMRRRHNLSEKVRHYRSLSARLRELARQAERIKERRELAEFQVQEIERAAIREGEDEELEAEKLRLQHAHELLQGLREGYRMLYEDEGAAFSLISRTLKAVEGLARIEPRLSGVCEVLRDAEAKVEDASFSLRQLEASIELDPQRLEQVMERLKVLNELKRKYGPTLAAVRKFKEELAKTLGSAEGLEEEIKKTEKEMGGLAKEIVGEAEELATLRKGAAKDLEAKVENELRELHMAGTTFKVEFRDRREAALSKGGEGIQGIEEEGFDEVEFMIAPNVGEPLMPLSKIASGGELSRIMLALKSILATSSSVETVIFDEVDSGISGGVAEVVGEKLLALSRFHQILCITHLPQIASKGQSHFLVKKEVKSGRTCTSITQLAQEERVEEIARLLGGKKITKQAISHAREMLG